MAMATQLDLYQLRAFHALGTTGSFTRAAQRLNLTQSAISHAITKLEASAETVLVDRKARELRLTEEGRRLFQACEHVFATLEAATEDLGPSPSLGRLRLGSTVEFGSSILMRHIRPFLAEHPGLEIDFTLAQDLLTPGDDIVSGSFQGRKETILIAAGDLHCRDHVPERYLEWPAATYVGELNGPYIAFSLVVLVHQAQ